MGADGRRIKVLFYAGSWDLGGARTQLTLMLSRLQRERFELHLLVPHAQSAPPGSLPADVVVHTYRNSRTESVSRWQRLSRIRGLLLAEKFDVLCDRTYLATLDLAVASYGLGIPRLSMAVADPAVQWRLYARWPRWLWRMIGRYAYRSATLVLANSEGLRSQMIQFWGLLPAQVQVQPNAFDFAEIDRRAEENSEQQPGENTSPRETAYRILTVGRIDADKGLEDLVSALQHLQTCTENRIYCWRIVGSGPHETAIRQAVQSAGLEAVVHFAGELANPYPEYRAADLFCLPSHSEGSPNVLIEALACGLPVISTDCHSGPREILADGRWGTLVPVGQPQLLADAIEAAAANLPFERQRAAAAGNELRERYSADVLMPRWALLLEDAAASRHARP